MAVVFACGAPWGGALESTLSLAEAALADGRDVVFIAATRDAYEVRKRLAGGLVRLSAVSPWLGSLGWNVQDRLTRQGVLKKRGDLLVCWSPDVPAAVRRVLAKGDVVVANSLRPLDLSRLLELRSYSQARLIWYLRETSSLEAVPTYGPLADVLLANSRPLAGAASQSCARPCSYVPSVIRREGLVEPTSPSTLLLVNPVPSHGVDLVLRLAALLPRRRFVLQESWPLDVAARTELLRRATELGNIEVRARVSRSEVFRDARVLLAPYSDEAIGLSRPRVALEAQLLGIPLVGCDVPGLSAVAASPDLLLAAGEDIGSWLARIDTIEAAYESYRERARRFADAEMPSAHAVWNLFVEACGGIL